MSVPQLGLEQSRVHVWRVRLLMFALVAVVVAIVCAASAYAGVFAPYPACYPNCAQLVSAQELIGGIAGFAAPALLVLGVIALLLRWRLPKLAAVDPPQRRLAGAIFATVVLLVGAAAYAVLFIVEFVPLLFLSCQVHTC